MAAQDYLEAWKLGKKAYRAHTSKGEYPYLPVLDELLTQVEIEKEANLGLIQIPLNRIIGTSTRGRTNAFASNWMPILEPGTEFASKWGTLFDSQLEEGIREPIKAYEYMNYYFVEEGNKRVSVMKYVDAVTIPGNVIRKVPKPTDDTENKIYYEFMEFNRLSGVNNIWFSQEGSFAKLTEAMGLEPDHIWTDDDRMDFSSVMLAFSKAFKAKGGGRLNITTADAFLIFINIYGYEDTMEMTSAEMMENMEKIWKEYLVLENPEKLELRMDPTEEEEENVTKKVLKLILPSNMKTLKVSFVYNRTPSTSEWNYGHELGRKYLEEQFDGQIVTEAVNNIDPEHDADAVLEALIANGSNIIFTTSSEFADASLKAAVNHPEVKILNCALNMTHQYIRTYFARMYESKFLAGMIAGAMTENNKIGYLADFPTYGTIANINAFALGAQIVNPQAKVYLEWFTLKDHDPYQTFWDEHISYVSNRDMITPDSASRQFGLYHIENDEITNLVMPVWNWGVFYEKLIRSIMSGSWKKEDDTEGTKALNYWWGISAGVVDIICSNKVPRSTLNLVRLMKRLIADDIYQPFEGEIHAQDGSVLVEENQRMTPWDIMTMDTLVENVIGFIPTMDQLREDALCVVKVQGVDSTKVTSKGKEV